jgi:DNA-binding NarL/FixJ family response regulator
VRTADDTEDMRRRYVAAGAHGFLLKRQKKETLLEAMKCFGSGRQPNKIIRSLTVDDISTNRVLLHTAQEEVL